MYSRRQFNKAMLASLPLAMLAKEAFAASSGVQFGTITYSFRDLPFKAGQSLIDTVIPDVKASGVGLIELMATHVEPVTDYMAKTIAGGGRGGNGLTRGVFPNSPEGAQARDELRKWRLSTPMSYFADIRKKFKDAGIRIFSFCVNGLDSDFTPEEIDRMFEQAKALGAATISSSATLSAAERVAPHAEKHKFTVAFHNHADLVDPNQLCKPESMRKVLAMSPYFRVNMDIAHYVQANQDPIPMIEEIHEKITHFHVADGRKDNQPEVPFGTGDTPIKQVITMIKEKKYATPAIIELEYAPPAGSSYPAEIKKSIAYCRQFLA